MLSDADIVVLSLLAEQPLHGYDLDRVIEQRGYRQWTSLAFSSVYYVLKRLAERGLVEPDEGSTGRRTVFRVTGTAHCLDTRRGHTDAELIVLDFLRNANNHAFSSYTYITEGLHGR